MPSRSQFIARLSGEGDRGPLFLPDLTLWYDWHKIRRSLPAAWRRFDLPQVARALGMPVWLPVRPWRPSWEGAETVTTEHAGERIVRTTTPAGTLTARWAVGPDGAWWQTEYPVKSAQDLPAALEWARARRFVLDTTELARLVESVGDDGLLALEIPRRPYSDLLHEFLGWSDGLMLLGEDPETLQAILDALEAGLQALVTQVAQLPGAVVISPDNLDGQYISPRAYRSYLAESYRATTEALHAHGKHLIVHVGGAVGRILALLAASGVDGVEGIAGPPQGDTTLAQARALAGPGMTLWGGIPQDALVATCPQADFESAVRQAVDEARGDARMLLGVADRVPENADLARLQALAGMVN